MSTDSNPMGALDEGLGKVVRFRDVRPNWRPGNEAGTVSSSPLYKYFDRQGSDFAKQVSAAATSDEFRLAVGVVVPGGGAGLHSHSSEELMFVATGTFVVYFDAEEHDKVVLETWDAIVVPADTPRGWRNAGRDVGCFLNISKAQDLMTVYHTVPTERT